MLEVALLPVSPTVEPAVLALNNEHAADLSWLDSDRLTRLLRQAFHAAQGFAEVGQAAIHRGSKTVRYLARTLERQ